MVEQDEFIRVGTTLYKIVDQPLIDGGCVKTVSYTHLTLPTNREV